VYSPELPQTTPAPHPEPDPQSWTLGLPIFHLESQIPLYRVDRNGPRSPVYFSRDSDAVDKNGLLRRIRNRFSDHWININNQQYGVLYTSLSEYGCCRETILRFTTFRRVSALGRIPAEDSTVSIDDRRISSIKCKHPLNLVDLTGAKLAWLNADGRLNDGDYSLTRQWSKAFWTFPQDVHGIYYRSRLDPSCLCVALYEDEDLRTNLSYDVVTDSIRTWNNFPELLNRYGFEQDSPELDSAYSLQEPEE
jgi:hypothetical protein